MLRVLDRGVDDDGAVLLVIALDQGTCIEEVRHDLIRARLGDSVLCPTYGP
jgi:hypothetical protein